MKTLLLASAAALTLGIGSAFAAVNGADTTQSAVTGVQSGGYTEPSTASSGATVPYAYNYNGQFVAQPRAQAPMVTVVPRTPSGAEQAYQDDAAGG
jgi:hypothetical protein